MNQSRNNNHYWDGGAFCENCGKLKSNVIDNGDHPIWHPNCKPGCNSAWYNQETIDTNDSCKEEERYNAEDQDEYERHCEEEYERHCQERCDYQDKFRDLDEFRHPYHEDDPVLEMEARAEYKREMEAQEREENEMEERNRQESRYGYYNGEDDDRYEDNAIVEY